MSSLLYNVLSLITCLYFISPHFTKTSAFSIGTKSHRDSHQERETQTYTHESDGRFMFKRWIPLRRRPIKTGPDVNLLGIRPVSTSPCVHRKKRGKLTERHPGAFVCRPRRRRNAADQRQQRDGDQSPEKHPHLLLFVHCLHLFCSCCSLLLSNTSAPISVFLLQQQQLSSPSSNSPAVSQQSQKRQLW